MNTAIIGCGFIAQIHAQAIHALGHTITMAIDQDTDKAQKFARENEIKHFSSQYMDAFSSDIQCVHICTPPALHYQMIKDALMAGKHVICEKPLCLESDQAYELHEIAKTRFLIHAVNFNVRFYDACAQAQKLISSSDFGKICLIHGSYLQEFHTLPTAYSWRYKPEIAGPMRATTEIGSHWIDLVRFWTGLEIAEVSANFGKFNPHRFVKNGIMYSEAKENATNIVIESEDAAVLSIRFSNGAIGNLLLSEVSHGRNNRLSIEVTGTNQSIWWHSENPTQLSQSQKSAGVITHTNAFSGGFPSTFRAFFKEVYQDIAANQPAQNPTYPTFYDGYVNTAICAAIYESANSNAAWVKLNY